MQVRDRNGRSIVSSQPKASSSTSKQVKHELLRSRVESHLRSQMNERRTRVPEYSNENLASAPHQMAMSTSLPKKTVNFDTTTGRKHAVIGSPPAAARSRRRSLSDDSRTPPPVLRRRLDRPGRPVVYTGKHVDRSLSPENVRRITSRLLPARPASAPLRPVGRTMQSGDSSMNTTVRARTLRSRLADLSQSMRNDTTIASMPARDHSRMDMEHVLEVLRNKSAVYAQRPTEVRIGDPLIPSVADLSFDEPSGISREPESPVFSVAVRGMRGFPKPEHRNQGVLNHLSRSIREMSGSPSPSSSSDEALFRRKERARSELQEKQKEVLELYALESPRRYMQERLVDESSPMMTLQSMEIARSSVSSLTELIRIKEEELAAKKSQYSDQRRTLVEQRRALLEQEMQLAQLAYLKQLEEEETGLAKKFDSTKKISDSLSDRIRSHSVLIEDLQSASQSPPLLAQPVTALSPRTGPSLTALLPQTPPTLVQQVTTWAPETPTLAEPLTVSPPQTHPVLTTPLPAFSPQTPPSKLAQSTGGPEMFTIGTPGAGGEGPEPSPYARLPSVVTSPVVGPSAEAMSPVGHGEAKSPSSGGSGVTFAEAAIVEDATHSRTSSGYFLSPATLVDSPQPSALLDEDLSDEDLSVGRTELAISPVSLAQFSPPMDNSPPHVVSDDITIWPQSSPVGELRLELVDFATAKPRVQPDAAPHESGVEQASEVFVEDLLAGRLNDLKTPPKPNRLFRRSFGSDDFETIAEAPKIVTEPAVVPATVVDWGEREGSPEQLTDDVIVETDFLTMTRLASDDKPERRVDEQTVESVTDAVLDSLIESVIEEGFLAVTTGVSSPRPPLMQPWRLPTRIDSFDVPADIEPTGVHVSVSVDEVAAMITSVVVRTLRADPASELDDAQLATLARIDFSSKLEQLEGVSPSLALCLADAFVDLLSSLPPAAAANRAWAAKCPGGRNPLAGFLPQRHSLQSILHQLKLLVEEHMSVSDDETERVAAVCKQFLYKFNLDEAAFQCNVAQFRVDEDAEAAAFKAEILEEVDEFILEAVMTSVAGDFFLPTPVLAS